MAISKKLRFEVFKRDGFKCQYCGVAAPDVVLHVDHIEPLAGGGADDLVNLITACAPCNLGKGARTLSDNSAVVKARQQLEELNERREQLEMMIEWRKGLQSLQADTVSELASYWEAKTPGWSVSDHGLVTLRKLLRRYTAPEVLKAMDAAADQYLSLGDDGRVTAESWEVAFSKIGGICRVDRASTKDPDLKRLYYIRGILRNRLSYFDPTRSLQWLRAARSWDADLDQLEEIALSVRNWTQFGQEIDAVIERQRKLFGTDDSEQSAV